MARAASLGRFVAGGIVTGCVVDRYVRCEATTQKCVYMRERVCAWEAGWADSGVSVSDVRQSGPKRLSSQANDSGGSPGELR